jgi:hypothetical protein
MPGPACYEAAIEASDGHCTLGDDECPSTREMPKAAGVRHR